MAGRFGCRGGAACDTVLNEGELPVVQTPTLVPRALFAGEAVLMVTCGGDFTAVATEAGSVYTFGFGGDGSLGTRGSG
jgi:alpha-tubulin suppressor-like RCC1 family protein